LEKEIVKTIIFEYEKAFHISHMKIAMQQGIDGYTMVVQNDFGFGHKPCDDMAEYVRIDGWHCYPVFSKTIDIDESFFRSAYNAIADSLASIFSAQGKNGLDGDGLTIRIASDEGHTCKVCLWAPSYDEQDCCKTNGVYQVFLQVLEKAGLSEWYKEH
jgi:hypothetical protein